MTLPDRLEADLEHLIKRVATFIQREATHFNRDAIQHKGIHNLVSYVDITAEKLLKEGCRRLIPDCGFINEETENEVSKNGYTWIIDPLDGTTNFLHGVPHYSISLALQYQQEIILGYVYGISADELFKARKGYGATLNGKPIHVSALTNLKQGLFVTGFPYVRESRIEESLEIFRRFLFESHGIRRYGSAALDLAYVACGRFDGFYEVGLNPWDIAAGALLVQEAGGKVSTFQGNSDFLFAKELIASNGKVHQEMTELILFQD